MELALLLAFAVFVPFAGWVAYLERIERGYAEIHR